MQRHLTRRDKDDLKLFLSFQNGDLDSYSAFYRRFFKPIYRFVHKQVKPDAVAEELTQDIFLKVYQYRKSYRPEATLSTWIWTIAKNTVYDYLRKHASNPTFCSESEHEPFLETTAESLMIEEGEKRKILTLLSSLSHPQKEAIFLRLVSRFSYQQISNSMNLSLSAVKSLINRGRNSLKKKTHPEMRPPS